MMTRVTMDLTDEELELVKQLRSIFKQTSNTGTVAESLRLTGIVVDGLKKGKKLVFLDSDGEPEYTITIPGLSAMR